MSPTDDAPGAAADLGSPTPEQAATQPAQAPATSADEPDRPHGSAADYRARRTLPLSVEFVRQLRRRRTQLTLGFLGILPFLLLLAFELGTNGSSRRQGGFVDLATGSGMNFTVFALFAATGFLLVVVVALFFGDTVASEASWSSLKYLLAIPVPRHRVLRQKAVVSGLLSLLGLVLLPTVSLLVGVIYYGAGDLVSPTGEATGFSTALLRMVFALAYLAVQLSWVAGLALLLSVSTDAPLGAVGGAVLVSILSQILDSITALGDLRNYLPTHYDYAWIDLLSNDWDGAARGALSAVSYAAVFFLLAGRRFARKDITS